MTNLFLSASHCATYARRLSILTAKPYHVLKTANPDAPRRVVSDEILHHLGLRCADPQVEFTADPTYDNIFHMA